MLSELDRPMTRAEALLLTPEQKKERRRLLARRYSQEYVSRTKGDEDAWELHKERDRRAQANRSPELVRKRNLWAQYRVTPELVTALWREQECRCAACNEPVTDPGLPVTKHGCHIDHCHTTGKVRGILCRACNIAFGVAKENPARLRALADYAEKHKCL